MDFKLVAFCEFEHGRFHGNRAAAYRLLGVSSLPVLNLYKLKQLT